MKRHAPASDAPAVCTRAFVQARLARVLPTLRFAQPSRAQSCAPQVRTHSQHHRNGHILRSLTPRRQQRPAVKQSRTPALIRFRIARERARKRRLHSKMCSDLLPPLPSPARSRRTHGHAPTWSRPSPQHAPVPSATRSAAGGRGKGHKSAETHARRGGRKFTHPSRAVRASRDLLPSPMNSTARARVRAGKILFFKVSRLPGQQPQLPTRRHAWCVAA